MSGPEADGTFDRPIREKINGTPSSSPSGLKCATRPSFSVRQIGN
ncbi:MAG: hypothetical protein ACLTYN_11680 [Dysosmobacter welbionis]